MKSYVVLKLEDDLSLSLARFMSLLLLKVSLDQISKKVFVATSFLGGNYGTAFVMTKPFFDSIVSKSSLLNENCRVLMLRSVGDNQYETTMFDGAGRSIKSYSATRAFNAVPAKKDVDWLKVAGHAPVWVFETEKI